MIKLEPKTAFVKKKAGQPAEAEDGRPVIKLILKADVSGSLEALSEIIKNLPSEKAKIEIIGEEVGDVSESDAKLAAFSGAIVVGFKTRIAKAAQNIAQIHNVKILTSEIIYELLKAVDELVSAPAEKPSAASWRCSRFSERKGEIGRLSAGGF